MKRSELLVKWPTLRQTRFQCHSGWNRLINETMQALVDDGFDPVKDQIGVIKSKGGQLRIYPRFAPSAALHDPSRVERLWEIIKKSQGKSAIVCETCGQSGNLIVDGAYWVTACVDHAPEHGIAADAWFQKKLMTKDELRGIWPCLEGVLIEHGRGWCNLLHHMLTEMTRAGFDQARDRITQIKEKLGSLRVYVDFDNSCDDDPVRADRVLTAMLNADESASTCEECGQPGQLLIDRGWWLTRCAQHAPDGAKSVGEYYGSKE
jgi:hypothetical protein